MTVIFFSVYEEITKKIWCTLNNARWGYLTVCTTFLYDRKNFCSLILVSRRSRCRRLKTGGFRIITLIV